MKNLEWQSLGWKVTRKLVFYAIVVVVLSMMIVCSCSLMNIASTLAFLGGLVGIAATFGVFVTFLLREINFYRNVFNKEQQTNTYETNN